MKKSHDVETKLVTTEEMNKLIQKSQISEHPYLYRFRFSLNRNAIVAKKIRKNYIGHSTSRRNFHTIDLDGNESLASAMTKIEQLKKKLFNTSY
ncbi:MAG: hypothetical protein GY754_28105 [bacterium]|nr:hypothetical protein [bacterium]